VDVTFLAPKAPESTEEPTQEMKLYVPGQLILQEEAGDFVWVADQSDQRARKTLVQTGLAGSNGLVEIKQGLTMTSRLIVGGIEGLEDGQRIKITGEEASPSASPSPAGKPKPLHRLHPGDGN
jgi:hypothetical protein